MKQKFCCYHTVNFYTYTDTTTDLKLQITELVMFYYSLLMNRLCPWKGLCCSEGCHPVKGHSQNFTWALVHATDSRLFPPSCYICLKSLYTVIVFSTMPHKMRGLNHHANKNKPETKLLAMHTVCMFCSVLFFLLIWAISTCRKLQTTTTLSHGQAHLQGGILWHTHTHTHTQAGTYKGSSPWNQFHWEMWLNETGKNPR